MVGKKYLLVENSVFIMNLKKKAIEEIIDKDNNLIGNDSIPKYDTNMDSDAHGTTDYNVGIHGQNFKNDFLGRFGFYYYESAGQEAPPVVKELTNVLGSEEKAHKIMSVIKPFIEDAFEVSNTKLDESEIQEDQLTIKKDDNSITEKKTEDESNIKLKQVADLLNKLPKNEINKLINLLEIKKYGK